MYIAFYYLAKLSRGDLGIPDNKLDAASVGNILNAVYFVAGFIGVLMIIIGGLSYVTASGDAGKAAKARNTIVYSAIGLFIVAMAFGITTFVVIEASK